VRDIESGPEGAAIIEAIITLARSRNLRVVAEGVETADEFAFLKARGCDEIQGYYFSRPVPAAEFARLVLEVNAPETSVHEPVEV
jgi:EAL domain-containing protein (putative c-di-GMP-specific phosphodiesterase class I)